MCSPMSLIRISRSLRTPFPRDRDIALIMAELKSFISSMVCSKKKNNAIANTRTKYEIFPRVAALSP